HLLLFASALPTLCVFRVPLPLLFLVVPRLPPRPTLFPYTTLFRSPPVIHIVHSREHQRLIVAPHDLVRVEQHPHACLLNRLAHRSEEHTSELQSRENLVCRLLLEKKKTSTNTESGQHQNCTHTHLW